MKELETPRLKLRRVTADDAQAIFDGWASDSEVTRYLTWSPHPDVSLTQTIVERWLEEYKSDPCYRYGIERKEDGTLMGMIDVVGFQDGLPVLGYCSGRRYWGSGYMTEALGAVVEALFADGYPAILIEAVRENVASNRVIEKNGFTFTGTREAPLSSLKPQIVTINSYRLDK